MEIMFLACAILGGTLFIIQFVMTVIGTGADDLDFGDGLPDDIPDDIPGGTADGHDSSWLFGVLSVRTVVAAVTFFGLAGLASLSSGLSQPLSFLIAVVAGAGALYGVHYLMQTLYRLRHDGTVRIDRTVGERATVYVPIPANHSGMGKVQIRTQGRIMEYAAKTKAPDRLKTGTTVEVVCVLSPMVLEVQPIEDEIAPAAPATSGDDVQDSVT